MARKVWQGCITVIQAGILLAIGLTMLIHAFMITIVRVFG